MTDYWVPSLTYCCDCEIVKGVEGTKVKTWVAGAERGDHQASLGGGVGEIPFGEVIGFPINRKPASLY